MMTTARPWLRLLAGLAAAWLLLWGAFLLLDRAFPFPVSRLVRPAASAVYDREGVPLRFFLPQDEMWRFPVELEEVSPTFVSTIIASEDRRFRLHPGVDPLAVLRAAWSNLLAWRVVSGGSTITMQVARMADPRPRTFRAKVIEAFRALQLERLYTKDEILTLYMNMTPYGGNVVGVGAASWFYFGKTPDRLSLAESALLTVLPKSPSRYDPVRHPEAARKARDFYLELLEHRGVFPEVEVREARAQPLPDLVLKPPFRAPHFSQMVHDLEGKGRRVVTSLDGFVQRVVEEKLGERAGWLRGFGIENAAVVVLDNETREIRALAGSIDFFDDERHGQINGVLIKRSPGSSLKPFLYALAMDQGRIVPESMLLDVPMDYSGYIPTNYDDTYNGMVSVRDSLVRSLNAPAVALLNEAGVREFIETLRQGGLDTIDKGPSHYGLALSLGACEVRLLDLAGLYAALRGEGTYIRPRYLPAGDDADRMGVQVFSPEAAFLTLKILAGKDRTDMPAAWSLTRDMPEVAWKTGTSFGHRDAWAIGVTGRYTIGVWVGNFDGRPLKGISGTRHAGPVLFDMFRALAPGDSLPPEPLGLDLDMLTVCREDRLPPGPFCPETMEIVIIPGRTRLPESTLHKQVFVDAETGLRLQGDCLMKRPSERVVVKDYPVELVAWWRSMGRLDQGMPPLSPLCTDVASEGGPEIVSPNPGTPYHIRRDAPAEFQKVALAANTPPDVTTLYWFTDGKLFDSGPPGAKLFLPLEDGEHHLVVMDDQGRMDAVTFVVE